MPGKLIALRACNHAGLRSQIPLVEGKTSKVGVFVAAFSARERGIYGSFEKKCREILDGSRDAHEVYYTEGPRKGEYRDEVYTGDRDQEWEGFDAMANRMLKVGRGRKALAVRMEMPKQEVFAPPGFLENYARPIVPWD